MPLTLSAIERIKLLATACNTLATALVTVGVFTPLAYQATTLELMPPERSIFLYCVMGLCTLGCLILHLVAQGVLTLLEMGDDD
jgi:hypothetical protein